MIEETPDVWMSAIMRKEEIEGLNTYDLGPCSEALVSYRVRKVLGDSLAGSQQVAPGLVVGGIRGSGMLIWPFGSDAPKLTLRPETHLNTCKQYSTRLSTNVIVMLILAISAVRDVRSE